MEEEGIANPLQHVGRVSPDGAMSSKVPNDIRVVFEAAGVNDRAWRKRLAEFYEAMWIIGERAADHRRNLSRVAVGEEVDDPRSKAGTTE
jgi:predicted GNAT superfamily acetyltransferase